MAHIVYIYIHRHHTLPKTGLSFDPHYTMKVKHDDNYDERLNNVRLRLNISKRECHTDNLYGEHIKTLNAIIGNNGAGKTSALRFLLQAIVSGSAHDISGIVVTKSETDNALHVYRSEDITVEIMAEDVTARQKQGWPGIPAFVYGGHVNVLTNAEDIMSSELTGMVNATDGYLLTADLQHYGRELSTNGFFALRDYATAFNCQNQWRICNFLTQYDSPLKQGLHLPRFILLLPNTAGMWALSHRLKVKNRIKYSTLEKPTNWTFREFRLAELIHYSLINYIADDIGERSYWEKCLDDWEQMIKEKYQRDIIALFSQFINVKQQDQYHYLLKYIYEVIVNVNIYCLFNEQSLWHYFYFQVDNPKMKTFLRWIQNNPIFLTSRYFDLHYAHHLDDTYTILSSGEKAMLDMYSRVYDAVITKHQRNTNCIYPTLFIFDEAEIGFHPEWQRQYIRNITLFLEDMAVQATQLRQRYTPDALDFYYQVIITSHSPIILSDVPIENVVMLKREDDGFTKNVSLGRQQTFGTNIFELYRDSFFLDGGLVGELSQEYILKLSKDIEDLENPNADTLDKFEKRISIVGDNNIREYLLEQLEPKRNRASLIAYYQTKIQELQNEPD